jgi:cation diffusion facilitator family transporter
MTELLVKLFVKNSKDTKDTKVRLAYGNLAGIVGILCNVLLFAGKYIIGTLFGSIAIAADAVNNLSDASSNIVSLLGFKLGSKKADEEHPYGHARYEYLAGLVVCVIIVAIGLSLAKESILKVIHPSEVDCNVLMIVVLLISICVKLWMSIFNKKIGMRIESDTLIATAADSRNDVISTSAVVVATILCKVTGLNIIDGIAGIGVAVFILYSGIGLIKETLSPLLGKVPAAEFVNHITEKIQSYPGVIGVHDYGPGNLFATVHVEFPAETPVIEAHEVMDEIERDFQEQEHMILTIHYDPIVEENAEVAEIRAFVSKAAKEFDERLSIHEVRLVPGNESGNVIFDCVKPAGFKISDSEISSYLQKRVTEWNPRYRCVIKVEQSYV